LAIGYWLLAIRAPARGESANVQVEWFALFVFAVGDFNGSYFALIDSVHAHYFSVKLLCALLAPTQTRGENFLKVNAPVNSSPANSYYFTCERWCGFASSQPAVRVTAAASISPWLPA
jgi:hypothetical protein